MERYDLQLKGTLCRLSVRRITVHQTQISKIGLQSSVNIFCLFMFTVFFLLLHLVDPFRSYF